MRTERVRQVVERSPLLSLVNYSKGQLLYRLGLRGHRSGATHSRMSVDESAGYVRRVVDDYLAYGEVADGDLAGRRVLEVGPGDNLGVAVLFAAKGAASVTCVDRFEPVRDEATNGRIYRRLYELAPPRERAAIDGFVQWTPGGEARFDPQRIDCRYGLALEDAPADLGGGRFDVIVSRAVLEHVAELEPCWRAMVALLAERGQMWHKIDFRNHGLFAAIHPLFFLTVGPRLWRLATSPDPTLNRERLPAYRRLAGATFEWSRVLITHVLENPELVPHREALEEGRDYHRVDLEKIAAIRSRLVTPFREMSDRELLVSGVFLICRRPRRLADRAA